MRKELISLFIFSVLLISCNKNQRITNNLAGTWNATNSIYTNEFGSIDQIENGSLDISVSFHECKLRDKEGCVANWKTTANTTGAVYYETYLYNVQSDGDTLHLSSETGSDLIFEITMLEKDLLKLKWAPVDSEEQREWHFKKEEE